MKKCILIAVLLAGVGVATSKAGVAFGINIGNGPGYWAGGYVNGGYARPSSGYTYDAGQYRYNPGYGYGYQGAYAPSVGANYDYYGQHQELHHELWHQHQDLHRDLDAQHSEGHRELIQEAQDGVPFWMLEEQHEAQHRALRHEHQDEHFDIQQQHREGHDALGWNPCQ